MTAAAEFNEWVEVQLGDVAQVSWGDTTTTKASYVKEGYRAFSASGQDGFLDHFDHEGPGIVLSAIGAQCGKTWFTDGQWACIKNTIFIKGEKKSADTRFLFYATQTPDFWPKRGAAQPFISQGDARKTKLLLPPVGEQRRIAAVLGDYDDLIAVNRRRIALLEEMARSLFEEWFVRFRFPGHEKVTLNETMDGVLPDRWRFGEASELIAFDPRTKVARDGEKPFISMGHLDTATSLIAPFETRTGNSGAKFKDSDTLFARITPCLENGKTGIVRGLPSGVAGFGSTEFIVMRAGVAGPAFTYCLARHPNFRRHAERGMAGASGRQRTRTEILSAYRLPLPPADASVLGDFEAVAWPMLDLVGVLGRANVGLAASRDLLLPRLISGQLTLPAADRQLEEDASAPELVAAE
jgi:type I restriction enzyme S subunit